MTRESPTIASAQDRRFATFARPSPPGRQARPSIRHGRRRYDDRMHRPALLAVALVAALAGGAGADDLRGVE